MSTNGRVAAPDGLFEQEPPTNPTNEAEDLPDLNSSAIDVSQSDTLPPVIFRMPNT
eukprot:CAMPEP_0201886514 /NCGR_PEP_ID=MMETSP0902-20130614/22298_1 /ASSEMBLY_ACC=CAM_ASM_000551 /TAXON_ID=420261 /ORGANISM="Thalassiosira antarctica, Strain CCMP982" /LENGTH=55 /DNA_ID=CAMNT_0048416107 /DNA_START=59 /DNA_END=222 /DNA_ORIENTATION=-